MAKACNASSPVLGVHSKIYVAGHNGLVGSAIMRKLVNAGFENIITRSHQELDLTNQSAVADFFNETRPEYVFLAAAKVGGILANNTYPAEFIYKNLSIQANVIESSHCFNVRRLMFLGSSCIYPKSAPQPIKEEYLLTGPLEPTNEPYAIAKIAGIKMCESFNRQYGTSYVSVMPTNLYGPNDNFNLQDSHVLPALIRKFHDGKESGQKTVTIWGTGMPRREFLHVDDMADACLHIMRLESHTEMINIGTGEDVTIRELADMIKHITGFTGEIVFDTTKPDGTPQKLLDVSRLKDIGWQTKISLYEGIRSTYEWFLEHRNTIRE